MSAHPAPSSYAGDPLAASWAAVVPVKPFARAKSRLASLGDEVRRDLVAAFALDVLAALEESRSVGLAVVVTDETALVRELAGGWAVAVPEGHSGDLNATLVQGAAEAARRRPDLRPLAICADLPALTPAHVDAVLAEVGDESSEASGTWFVGDETGTGTTTYLAASSALFRPRYGPGSARAHSDAGAVDLSSLAPAALRRDVDTPDELEAALALGVGERTRWVVTRHRL